jgi:hypothetical protein
MSNSRRKRQDRIVRKAHGISVAERSRVTCAVHGVPLSVAYYRREWPIVRKMHELLSDGAIGRVVPARVQWPTTSRVIPIDRG